MDRPVHDSTAKVPCGIDNSALMPRALAYMMPASVPSPVENMSRLTPPERIQLTIILLLGFALRLYRLGAASIWLDETATIRLSKLPFSRLWLSAYDSSPPLYYSIIKLLLPLGQSEFALRLPSVLFGTATIAVIYLTGRKLAGPMAASAAALLLALSFPNIEYSQEARHYALLGFCLSLSLYGLVTLGTQWRDSGSGFNFSRFICCGGGLYALGVLAALYTHNVAVFYWLGTQCFFLAWWARPLRFATAGLGAWFVLNLAVLLLWLPWFLTTFEVLDTGIFSWLPQADAGLAFDTWRAVHGFRAVPLAQPFADLMLLAFGLAGLYALRRNYALFALFAGLMVFSSVIIWAYGFVSTPVFMLRTILWGTLPSCLLVSVGVSRLPRTAATVAIAVMLALYTVGVTTYFKSNLGENENWRGAAKYFEEHWQPGDLLLIRAPYVARPFFYYVEPLPEQRELLGWDCNREKLLAGTVEGTGRDKQIRWDREAMPVSAPFPPKSGAILWLVESHCGARDWTVADAVFWPNWRLVETVEFKGVDLHRLASSGPR